MLKFMDYKYFCHMSAGGGGGGGRVMRELMSSTGHQSNDCFLENFVP